MLRALAVAVSLLLAAACALLLLYAIFVADIPICSELDGFSDEDDCVEASRAERILGLVLAFGSVAAAGIGTWLGVRYGRRGEGGRGFAIAAIATPLLALGALALLRVSF